MFPEKALTALEDYFASGEVDFDFCKAGETGKGELLELLERLMDVADLADEAATRLIFQNSFLASLTGVKDQT